MDRHAQVSLPAATTSPTSARSFVRDLCEEWGLPDLADDLALLASELVTNAVVHAGSPWIVTLSVVNGAIELTVEDCDSRAPEPRPARHDLIQDLDAAATLTAQTDAVDADPRHHTLFVGDAGSVMAGRGLLIIDTLSLEWGTLQRAVGKAVWVRLPAPGGQAAGARSSAGV